MRSLFTRRPCRYAAPELYQSLPYSPEKVDVWVRRIPLGRADRASTTEYFSPLGFSSTCSFAAISRSTGEILSNCENTCWPDKFICPSTSVPVGETRSPQNASNGVDSPADCGSLIRSMLTIDPEQRCTIDDIKKHPWVLLTSTDASTSVSIPNEPLANAILGQAERLGYNRQQILESVHGNSYDSDAAIWHLLMEKFQKTCQIQRVSREAQTTEWIVLDEPQAESIPSVIEQCAEDDELVSEQLRTQYNRLHPRLFARPSTTAKPTHRLSTSSRTFVCR
jgi:serine/threonine protein kinase